MLILQLETIMQGEKMMEPQKKRKIYQEPAILYELELETRAGSEVESLQAFNQPEFNE